MHELQYNNTERIHIEDLIQYIEQNKKNIKQDNVIDLNSFNGNTNDLQKLAFQDVKHIYMFTPILEKIFDAQNDKYLHAGVLKCIIGCDGINISLYSSIITCLKQTFLSQNSQFQQNFIIAFIECLKKNLDNFDYKQYKWDKNDLRQNLDNCSSDCRSIKYISDFLCINIFILDIKKDKIIYGGGNEYIPYKKTIFLIYYGDENYEPLYTEHTKFFSIDDKIVKLVRRSLNLVDIFPLCPNIPQTVSEQEEKLDSYIVCQNEIVKKDNTDNKYVNNKFIDSTDKYMMRYIQLENDKQNAGKKQDDIIEVHPINSSIETNTKIKYTLKELKVKKLQEIQEIATTLKIVLTDKNKKKTKDQLIQDILTA